MRFPRPCVPVALLLVVLAAAPAAADEIRDQIDQAIQMYNDGDYAGAASELEFAAAQIRQLRAGEISGALPEPLPGWNAEDAETAAMGAAFFGGGTSASRRYTNDEASIEIQITTDSPMMQSLSMLMSNPMLMRGSGQKLVRVQGHKASLEWEDDGGELNVVVNGTVLVAVEGSGCTEKDLMAYAEAVDYEKIKQIIGN
ncbi:MAG: hypothetical protein R6X25_05980 [Candidatus Krumholzibacteriia bacterium]